MEPSRVVIPEREEYEFGPYRLEPVERLLARSGTAVPLTPKAFDLLVVLVRRAGHVIAKDELLREVWPGTFVEEANLSYTVSLLRKALEDGSGAQQYIATVQKLGYRFAAAVTNVGRPTEQPRVADFASRPAAPTQTVPVEAAAPRWKLGWRYAAVAATLLVLAAIATVAFLLRPGSVGATQERLPARLDIALPVNVEEGKEPSISPDGRVMAMTARFGGVYHLAIRRLDSPDLKPIAGTMGGWLPIWSPDSRSVAFLLGRTLTRVELGGGQAVKLVDVPGGNFSGGAWSPDGVILLGGGSGGGPIARVLASGGALEPLTTLDTARGETAHQWPHFLPGGRRFFYTAVGPNGGLYVGALDGRKPKRVLNDARAGRYVQSGHVLFLRGQTLLAQEFDSDALEARGDAVPIAENVGLGAALGAGFSASTAGTVVYRPIQDDPTQLFWFGRDGSRHAPVGPAGSYRNAVLSPSGRQVALARRDPATGDFDIYALDITTGVLSRQTNSPAFEHDPVWSPDERTLAFGSNRTTWMRAYRKDLSTGSEALLADLDAEYVSPKDWTLDGRLVVLQTPKAIYAVSADGTAKPRRLTTTASILVQLQVSPEGKLIAFGSTESGRWEVYVASFPDFTDKRQVSIDGGVQPLWRRDGRELFFLTFEGALMSVPIGVNGIPAAPQRLFEATQNGVCCFTEYGVTADGQRFLFMERKPQTITILMNWLDRRETN